MTTEELDLFEKVVRNYVAEHDSEYNNGEECKLGTAAKVYKKQLEEVTAQLGRSQAKVEKLQAEHEEEK